LLLLLADQMEITKAAVAMTLFADATADSTHNGPRISHDRLREHAASSLRSCRSVSAGKVLKPLHPAGLLPDRAATKIPSMRCTRVLTWTDPYLSVVTRRGRSTESATRTLDLNSGYSSPRRSLRLRPPGLICSVANTLAHGWHQ
jgi:hypothetical protein